MKVQEIDDARHYEQFIWASPKIKTSITSRAGALRLEGYAHQKQNISLQCKAKMIRNYGVKRGYFDVTLLWDQTQCADSDLIINSDWHFLPSDSTGSIDGRKLSYQIFRVEINGNPLSLEKFLKKTKGVYHLEKMPIRDSVEKYLTLTWDASWYQSIINDGYRFNGDARVQHNVAWPFLFPFMVKAISYLFDLESLDATLTLNAWLVLLAMIELFVLGKILHVSNVAALIAPVWLVTNPFAVFLFGGFSESLFIMLEVFLIIVLLKRWWWIAAFTVSLMVATRLIGLLGLIWLLAYWYLSTDNKHYRFYWHKVSAWSLIAISGLVVDMLIKFYATGFLFSVFQIRSAWEPSDLLRMLPSLSPLYLSEGQYTPILLLVLFSISYSFYILYVLFREKSIQPAFLVASGLSMVLSTWLLNPEIHAAGRYSLPFVPAVVGTLAVSSMQYTNLAVFCILIALGGSASGLVVALFYQSLPPF